MSRSNNSRPTLSASGIGEYIRFSGCPRYFKLRFESQEQEKKDRKWAEAFKPLSVLLYGSGDRFEEREVEWFKENGSEFYSFDDLSDVGWEKFRSEVVPALRRAAEEARSASSRSRPVAVYQAPVKGSIGAWSVEGKADLILIWPAEDGKIRLRAMEIKASWKERSYHQIQASIYAYLLEKIFDGFKDDFEVGGGVIYRKTDVEGLEPQEVPSFNVGPRISDLKRLMSEGGRFDLIHQTPLAEIRYQLAPRCENCIYAENCFTRAVESESLAVLGLKRGEQKILSKHGIETLADLAGLKEIPESPVPFDYEGIPERKPEKAAELIGEPGIGGKLDKIVQRSQVMLGEVHPNHELAKQQHTAPWLMGSGNSRLPEDNPSSDDINLDIERGSLIRVYLTVQWDYMGDQIVLIAARVDCTNYEGEPILISEIVERIPSSREGKREEERKMLERFFRKLFKNVQNVSGEIGHPERAPIHLYLYTQMERDRLMDAIRRHESLSSSRAVRDLLGLREAIDQPMVSIVQNEVRNRKALKYPSKGLLPVLDQLYYPKDEANGEGGWWNQRRGWMARRKDGTQVNLRRAFYRKFFNYESPYKLKEEGSIELMFEKGAYRRSEKEGWYPIRPRYSNQIPLEYVWASKDRLNDDWARNERDRAIIDEYRWHEPSKKEKRVTEEDLRLLAERLCDSLEHIERSITYRNPFLGKQPIEIPQIPRFSLGETSLARACREYLDLEYFTNRQQMFDHYALSPKQRVETGKSAAFRATNVVEEDGVMRIEGELLYEELDFARPDLVANSCRLKGSGGFSSGSWMIITELTESDGGRLTERGSSAPRNIERSVPVTVNEINPNERSIEVSAVHLHAFGRNDFEVSHSDWTTEPEESDRYTEYFEEGRLYILDPRTDNLPSARAADALDAPEQNRLYSLLNGLMSGERESLEISADIEEPVLEFIDWLGKEYTPSPNREQRNFIMDVGHQISLLQGPPGTGKTEAALGFAVLGRVMGYEKKSADFKGLVTAPSNKAIHEIISDIAACKKEYSEKGGEELDSLRIIRVTSNEPPEEQRVENVEYVDYHEDTEAVGEISDHLTGQRSLLDYSGERPASRHVLIFATPTSLYGLMRSMKSVRDSMNSIQELLEQQQGYFDLLAVDEASMMQLSDFILSGAFISQGSQILVCGDHRQMPPVQVHDWGSEDRRTVEEVGPYLSALDFLRFLRGEKELEHVDCNPEVEIPMYRLKTTYRCHHDVTEMLRRWVYEEDNIDFRSDLEHTIEQVEPRTRGMGVMLNPDSPLVVALHDERESQQSNKVEASIIKSIADQVHEDVGVVTPHNAQRGLLKNELGEGIRVDTVERFQGGQRDIVVLSGTVSDPDYVKAESDFILNRNRLNVAMSRMRKKLIVVASRSIFDFVPPDAESYEEALLWRGLYEEVGASTREPDWKGSLGELLDLSAGGDDVEVEVYAS